MQKVGERMLEGILFEGNYGLVGGRMYWSKLLLGGIEAKLFTRTQPNCKCHLSSVMIHMESRPSEAPLRPGSVEVALGTKVTNSTNGWEIYLLPSYNEAVLSV